MSEVGNAAGSGALLAPLHALLEDGAEAPLHVTGHSPTSDLAMHDDRPLKRADESPCVLTAGEVVLELDPDGLLELVVDVVGKALDEPLAVDHSVSVA